MARPDTPAVFRDLAYRSRTLVLTDGRTFAVERSRIEASDPALIAFLSQNSEFERQPPNAVPAEPTAEV
ncbi:hypothetical protein [Microvirgula aerodenitrificans]|uniref:hypothetical protein n=1 Tax=Microvirgula aerodenitrificans TaxID=57480 RepID=UPI00131EFDA3|nr:hypothetical protein [Microvirgula aerodenitrificans]